MSANNWGGSREGSGRKSKAEEQSLIEKLSPLEDKAFAALSKAIGEGKSWAIKIYFEYMFGKPKDMQEIELKGGPVVIPNFRWGSRDDND